MVKRKILTNKGFSLFIPANLHWYVAECDGTGEPNIEPQVRECLRSLTNFALVTVLLVLFMIMIPYLSFVVQFLDWVDEGVKCPYCEGLGHTICDACEGKTTI